MITANILDPIHDTLAPEVWEDPSSPDPKLKPHHHKWIVSTITSVLKDAGYTNTEEWLSLVLTGSLTTYQYDKGSDCDVSIFVDINTFPEWSRAEMIGVMITNIDGRKLPGTPYPMQCFVVPPDVGKSDLYRPGLRSGYDLIAEEWINPPERERSLDVESQLPGFYAYALQQADKMESLLKYEPEKAKLLWHQIHERRRRDQKAGKGDYAESNIVYKFLANRGLFPELSELTGEYIAKLAREANDELITHIYETTMQNEGITIAVPGGQMPQEGFAFSEHPGLEVTVPVDLFTKDDIVSYINENINQLTLPNSYLGIWIEKGLVYLDVSTVLNDEKEAIDRAKAANQLAIFNLKTFETIPVNQIVEGKTADRWTDALEQSKDMSEEYHQFVVDEDAVQRAADQLGIQMPVDVQLIGGTSGEYGGFIDNAHRIRVVGWLQPDRASRQIWHELAHALQLEQNPDEWHKEMQNYINVYNQGDQAYREHPWEVEANKIGDANPFPLTIAKEDLNEEPDQNQEDLNEEEPIA